MSREYDDYQEDPSVSENDVRNAFAREWTDRATGRHVEPRNLLVEEFLSQGASAEQLLSLTVQDFPFVFLNYSVHEHWTMKVLSRSRNLAADLTPQAGERLEHLLEALVRAGAAPSKHAAAVATLNAMFPSTFGDCNFGMTHAVTGQVSVESAMDAVKVLQAAGVSLEETQRAATQPHCQFPSWRSALYSLGAEQTMNCIIDAAPKPSCNDAVSQRRPRAV